MTYHRTAGKGGTRNSRASKHPELSFPNFNKSTVGGRKLPPRKGKVKLNPGKTSVYNRSTGEFQKPAAKMDANSWWRKKLGFGGKRADSGALAKRRKANIDANIERLGG
jgi:hypothetical protein